MHKKECKCFSDSDEGPQPLTPGVTDRRNGNEIAVGRSLYRADEYLKRTKRVHGWFSKLSPQERQNLRQS